MLAAALCLALALAATAPVHARGKRRPAPTPPPTRPTASPAKSKAAVLLKRGLQKLHSGLYYDAIEDFKKGLALYSSPSFYYNMGLAYQELRKYVLALGAFESYVAKTKDPKGQYAKLAREWVKILRQRIATVHVRVNVPGARVTVAGRVAGVSPKLRAIRIQPEKDTLYDVKVTKPGYETESGKDRQIRLVAGKAVTITIKLITSAEAFHRRQEYKREVQQRLRIQQRLRRARAAVLAAKARRRRQIRYAGWSLVVTGATIVALGGALGIVSLLDKKYVEDSPYASDYDDYSKRYERSILFSKLAWAGLGTGVAIATVGAFVVWWINRRPEVSQPQPSSAPAPKPKVNLQPILGPGSAGVSLRLRY